ncbi:hypothetical protein EDC96DRAFT_534419 [Choanephora cucurbitarum]|nr:hypothetical protein EDC96DRAFT_534419 [Choanephora cucurbitarum]
MNNNNNQAPNNNNAPMMEVDELQEACEQALDLRREHQAKFKNGEPADDLLRQYMLAAREVEDLRRTSAIMFSGEMPRLMGPHEKPEGKYDGLFRNVKQFSARLERYADSQEIDFDAAHDKCLLFQMGNNYRVHYERQMVSATANGNRVAEETVKSWLIEYCDTFKQRAESRDRGRIEAPNGRLSQGPDSVPQRRGTDASRWVARRRRTACDRCGDDYQPGHNRRAAIRVVPPAQEQEPALAESRVMNPIEQMVEE